MPPLSNKERGERLTAAGNNLLQPPYTINELLPLLDAFTPISKKLAEKVIQNSADKIRPHLTQAVKSLNASFDDFSEVVASVCRENVGTIRHSND